MLLFIGEIISAIIEELFLSSFTNKSLNTKKIDNNITKLKNDPWFLALFNNHRYHKFFFVNRNVRKYLQSNLHVSRILKSDRHKQKFINLLDKEIEKSNKKKMEHI